MHDLVELGQAGFIEVERVAVLHQKFARPHHAEAWPDLVAELGLDLVKADRQLLVRAQLGAGKLGDDFFMGRAEGIFATGAIMHLQQLGTESFPATGLLPQLGRLHRGHQQFETAGRVHFLAHHPLDPTQHPQAQRGPGVDAAGELADHAATQHQAMAGDLGVGGNLA